MSNSGIRLSTPVEQNDFEFQPMHPDYRPRTCAEVTCNANATQVRYKKDLYDGLDKSSKTFVCDAHLLTTNV